MDVQELARLILAGGTKKFNKTNDTLGNVLSRIGEAGFNHAVKRTNEMDASFDRMSKGEVTDDDIMAFVGMTGPVAPMSRTSELARSIVTQQPLDKLISHEGAPDGARVQHYINQIIKGEPIAPLSVIREGMKLGIEDGKHRFEALRRLGRKFAPTIEI